MTNINKLEIIFRQLNSIIIIEDKNNLKPFRFVFKPISKTFTIC